MKNQVTPSMSSMHWSSQRLAVSALLLLLAAPVQAQSAPGGFVIHPHAEGEGVAALQQQLLDLGYYQGPVTGYFDPATQAAVTQFQQANGLDADGIVGSATQRALSERYAAAPQTAATGAVAAGASASSYLQLNDSGDQVVALQQQLAQQGYLIGTPSGVFDQQTQAAVMNFQRDRGLSVDGIVGSATEVALTGSTPAQTAAATPSYTPAATPNDGLIQLGDEGTEVSDLQTRLQALGYYTGPISGSFGSQTQTALIAFQQSQGLTADGIAGPQVTAALGGSAPVQPASQTTAAVTQPAQPVTAAPAVVSPAPAVTVPPVTATVQPAPTIGQPIPALDQPPTVQVPPMPAPSLSPQPVQTQTMLPPAQPLPPSNVNPPQSQTSGRFTVLDLQRRLQLNGFEPADMSGVFDATTQNAIMQAQQAYGLSQNDLFER